MLMKLEDYSQPGLYEEEFKALLGRMVKCACGMVMGQRVFKEHRCVLGTFRPFKRRKTLAAHRAAREVIDLTMD